MLEDLFFDNLDSIDEIDTSDADWDAEVSEDSSDFYDSFIVTDDMDLDEYDDFQCFAADDNSIDDELAETQETHNHHEPTKSSQISFGLGCHCIVHGCGCRSFEGKFRCVCTNCGHGYDKHF